MVKRSQPGRRRARGGQRGRERELSPAQGRPGFPSAGSAESGAAVDEPTRREDAVQASPGAQSRHIARDYSYVQGELRRVAITGAIIFAGLVVTAVVLR